MENIKHIIESLLFVAEEPLTVDKIKNIAVNAETKEIRSALAELSAEYEDRLGGFYLDEVAGGFQIRTRPEYNEWIRKLIQPKPMRLSKAALETLVIIAYKQPIIRSDIEYLRGVDCGGVLRVLLERKLIRVLGRREIAGRPLIYATTKRFLEIFDLKDLKDLPTPKEIEDLGASLTESDEPVAIEPTDEIEGESEPLTAAKPNVIAVKSDAEKLATEEHHETAGIQPNRHQGAEVSSEAGNITGLEEARVIRVSPAPSAKANAAPDSLIPTDSDHTPKESAEIPKEENA